MTDYWKALPKIDLHCHLDGSLPVSYVDTVLREQGTGMEPAELREALTVSEACGSLPEYLEKFALPLRCMDTPERLQRAAYAVVQEAALENVRYLEVRFAPMLSVCAEMDCAAVIENVVLGFERAGREFGVHTGAITCAMRHHTEETNLAMMKTAREYLGNGVCALDLAGDESAFATSGFRRLFTEAKKLDFPFTIHSGECGSVENVEEAIALGARRMGHGIALVHSRSLQKLCAQKGIGIEMCPTSNVQTGAVAAGMEYPLRRFLQNGLAVSVNTDNRTVSNTTLTKELHLITQKLGVEDSGLKTLLCNAAETAFTEDQVKQELLEEIAAFF